SRVPRAPRTATPPPGRARCRDRRRDDRGGTCALHARRGPGDRCTRRRRPGRARSQRRSLMSWTVLIALCVISFALKAIGPVLVGGRELRPSVRRVLDLVAVPLLAALILVQTL